MIFPIYIPIYHHYGVTAPDHTKPRQPGVEISALEFRDKYSTKQPGVYIYFGKTHVHAIDRITDIELARSLLHER